jgi:hypothetical protein
VFRTRVLAAILLVFAGVLVACDGDEPQIPCACTEEFRSYHLTVLDGAGQPADGVDVRVVRVRTGERLIFGSPAGTPGVYVIMDDSFTDRIAEDESFQVSGVRGEASFVTEHRFGTDECRCHVLWLAGPDSVSLQP